MHVWYRKSDESNVFINTLLLLCMNFVGFDYLNLIWYENTNNVLFIGSSNI